MTYVVRSDELYHHGILGQKWGIRRFQNPDGTLTREGKARYKTDSKFKKKYDRFKRTEELVGEGVNRSVAKRASKYEQKGMDSDTALAKASKRVETGKAVAAAVLSAVGVVSASAIALSIKPNTTMPNDEGEWITPNIYRGTSSFKLDNGELVTNRFSMKIG